MRKGEGKVVSVVWKYVNKYRTKGEKARGRGIWVERYASKLENKREGRGDYGTFCGGVRVCGETNAGRREARGTSMSLRVKEKRREDMGGESR